MLHIILVILKILGILLAALLFLLLFLLLSVLFVPLRYQLEGQKEGSQIGAEGNVHWFLHLIGLNVRFREKKLTVSLRILFFKKMLAGEKENREQKKKVSAPKLQEKPSENQPEKKIQKKPPENLPEKKIQKKPQEKPPERKIKSSIFKKIQKIPETIREKFKKLGEKLSDLKGKGESLKQFLQSPEVKIVYERFKGYLIYLWKHLKPKRLTGRLHYGFADPSQTGEVTGIGYLFLTRECFLVELEPDFEQTVMDGNLQIKGKIRLCYLAWIAWKVFWDKEFKIIRKKLHHA